MQKKWCGRVVGLIGAAVVAWTGMAGAADQIPPAAMNEAKEIFKSRCSPCHGPQGAGDGPAAAGLSPKPRSFGDSAWQKSATDEQIDKIILQGGAAVGKSPMMPPNPDLSSKPQVVQALRVLVRDLGKQK